MQPIVKWSGSKRSQAKQIVGLINKATYDTYYEPFCGGCSVLFYLIKNQTIKFKRYVCSDINNDLIQVFLLVKNEPQKLFETYQELWLRLNEDDDLDRKKQFFHKTREEFNKTKNPFLFFFIMRTTTNGMPRYNSKGEFNNSFHITRKGIEPNRLLPILLEWHNLLNQYEVEFINTSYENIVPNANDLLYMDPPYANTKGMYYGTINYEDLWAYLEKCPCEYLLSFDGVAGTENNIVQIPQKLYDEHFLLNSGNSSFRRTIGKRNNIEVLESLYIKRSC